MILLRILVLSPHPDDAELGAGATISRFKEEDYEIGVFLIATKEKLPDEVHIKSRIPEFKNSMKILGVNDYIIGEYPIRNLYKFRQDLLDDIIQIQRDYQPDLVLMPSLTDIHQDHVVVARECIRAFNRKAKMLSYELPWNTRDFKPTFFVKINEKHLHKKIEALKCYKSQILLGKPYINVDFIKGIARYRGIQCNSIYAEAYETIYWYY